MYKHELCSSQGLACSECYSLADLIYHGLCRAKDGTPEEASDPMMLRMRAGRISARVLGVLETIVFQTCSAADRTV